MAAPAFLRKLFLGRDDGGYVTNEIPWPAQGQANKIKLDNGVEKTLVVPTWAYRIMFVVSPGAVVWCGHGGTPLAIASDATFTSDLSELNPVLRPAFDASNTRISTVRLLSETDDVWVQVIFYGANKGE